MGFLKQIGLLINLWCFTATDERILRLVLPIVRFHTETLAPLRRGGRAVECACLENKYVGNGIAGSNPVPSAKFAF